MKFEKEKIEKKIKQKQIRLSERNNEHLNKLSQKFKISETDIINLLLENISYELNFIEKCEKILKNLKEDNNNLNIKIITNPNNIFIGYYPSNNKNYFAYVRNEIFVANSYDKNYNYFIVYRKTISLYEAPNSNPGSEFFFCETKYVNDLYNEFKNQGFNIKDLILDKNYNDSIISY